FRSRTDAETRNAGSDEGPRGRRFAVRPGVIRSGCGGDDRFLLNVRPPADSGRPLEPMLVESIAGSWDQRGAPAAWGWCVKYRCASSACAVATRRGQPSRVRVVRA